MTDKIIQEFTKSQSSKKVPDIKPGMTVEVETIIRDGDKQRIQKFRGFVIAVKGSGSTKTFTVRKISYGIGVEKIFPIYSTNVGAIKILKMEPVRRSKLYFMRDRVGKSAMRVRKGRTVLVPEEGNVEDDISPVEETTETAAE